MASKIATQIRLDENIHAKAKYIADKEIRSLNAQMEYFILKGIELFEKEYGVISVPLPDEK